ncbi:MAG: DUF983 domain-containing protein [Rhodospirillaceae bacterium]|nr:DUF983 domain-containing protein [Rhodospirillaceae bacterium]
MQAALACACPRCGKGRLFKGFLKIADRCDSCGLDLAKQDSGDGPAVFLIFILGALGVPLAFWIQFSFELPMWVAPSIASVFIVVLALVLLRPAKALVVALQYRHRRNELEDG